MASSIYNILKKMYTEIQSEVTQSDFNETSFNARNYKVMDVMDYSRSNNNQRTNSVINNTQSNNAPSNNAQRSNTPSNNSQRSNTQSNDDKSNNNLRNYNQADNYSGDNLGVSKPTTIISVSDEKQKEVVKKLQQAVIMAEVLSQPVCRTRGHKRNKINKINR